MTKPEVSVHRLLWGALAIVVLAQLGLPLSMIASKEATLRQGKVFHFETAPVDPVDVLRGRYVRLAYTQTSVPAEPGLRLERGQAMYVSLEVGEKGLTRMTRVSDRKPPLGDYLKLRAGRAYEVDDKAEVYVRLPFDRFYMEEHKAPSADVAMARLRTQEATEPSYAVVRVRDGRAVLEDVVVGGQPIVEAAEAVAREASSSE